jgi:uncharacterized protein (TIGR04255 family)
MAEQEFAYPRAPITEAVLDIRVEARSGIEASDLLPVLEEMKDSYANTEDQFELHALLIDDHGSQQSNSVSRKKIGFRARHAKDRLYQAQVTGFSFNKLAPYDRWATFKSEAKRIWSIYRQIARPVSITRLGLRYINKIDIPVAASVQLKDYFRAYIEISDEVPETKTMSNFLFQVHLPQVDLGGLCVINCAALPPAQSGTASILLDIDVFKLSEAPQQEADVWALFDKLRQRKNSIFEACITDRTRELFK